MRLSSGLANHRLSPAALSRSARVCALGAGFAALMTAFPGSAQTPPSAGPTAAGFWQSTYDDGRPSGWFHFTDHDGVYEGRLVKMFPKEGETTLVKTCSKCEGDRKDAPMLGLLIVWAMKHHGLKYEDGKILDPRDGTVYNAQMEVTPDGQKLLVRGYLGISLLGQTKTWTRLPDDSIPAGAIPGETLGTPPAKKKAATPAKSGSLPEKTPAAATQ